MDEKVGGREGDGNKYNFSCLMVGLRGNACLCCLLIKIKHRTLSPVVVRSNRSWTCATKYLSSVIRT